jgi:hypothetical protein
VVVVAVVVAAALVLVLHVKCLSRSGLIKAVVLKLFA